MMKLPKELDPLEDAIRGVQNLIDEFEGQGIIIGGVAVSILARARYTADADAMIFLSIDDFPKLVRLAAKHGFISRDSNYEQTARVSRMFLLSHQRSGLRVDISLGALPFEAEAIERSQVISVGDLRLRVPSVEDLIILKAIAHRPKDAEDIRLIIQTHPELDRERIERWVREFASVLESPEVWNDLAPLLRTK